MTKHQQVEALRKLRVALDREVGKLIAHILVDEEEYRSAADRERPAVHRVEHLTIELTANVVFGGFGAVERQHKVARGFEIPILAHSETKILGG